MNSNQSQPSREWNQREASGAKVLVAEQVIIIGAQGATV